MGRKMQDLTGRKFDRLTVKEFSHSEGCMYYWKCKCECGKEILVTRSNLVNGNTKSCGCLKQEVNASKTRRVEGKTTADKKAIKEIQLGTFTKKKPKRKINYRKSGEIKCYKLSPAELETYLEELKTKDVQYAGKRVIL